MVRAYAGFRLMNEQQPRFYFALPRLLALFRHGDTSRAEINGGEAWAGSIAVFLVSYLFFAGFVPDLRGWWVATVIFAALPFFVLLFWLLALYANSLILKLLRVCGLFRSLPQRRGQAVLIGLTTTVMAVPMVQRGFVSGEIASIWLVAVALNLAAAAILGLRHGRIARS